MIKATNHEKKIILLGAGGHAKVAIETIRNYYPQYNIIGITEKEQNKIGHNLSGIPIIGTDENLQNIYFKGVKNAFVTLGTVGNPILRRRMFQYIKKIGFICPNIIHGKAILSDTVVMGEGNLILTGAILNVDSTLGNNCIINTGSIVEHDCILGNNVHIAPGGKLSGGVTIEDNVMIGIGASVIQGLKIGCNSVVGAGAVVLEDIPPNSIAVGVPAKIIKKISYNNSQ